MLLFLRNDEASSIFAFFKAFDRLLTLGVRDRFLLMYLLYCSRPLFVFTHIAQSVITYQSRAWLLFFS